MDAITSGNPDRGLLLLALRALFRRRRLFVGILVTSIAAVAAWAVLAKRQYRSEMKFIVHSARSNAVLSPDHDNTSVLMVVSEEQLNSELEILQSEDVLSKVADPSWDPALASSRSNKELKEHAKRLASFTKRLTVEPIRKADVISLSYLASTPQEARDTLTTLAATYLVQHERLQRPTGTSLFYDEEASRYKREWSTAVADLVSFQQLHQLVSVADVEEKLQKAIAEGEEALRKTQVQLGENNARMHEGARVLKGLPTRQQSQQRALPSQLLIQQLRTQLASFRNHRTELLTRYGASDRLVLEVDQQISDTNRAIESAVTEKSMEDTTDINPPWQQLTTSMVEGTVEHQGLLGTESSVRSELGALRTSLSEVQSLTLTFEQLRAHSEQAQANFEAFAEKRDRAHVEDAMDAGKLLNVTVMETPTLSFTPARPHRLLTLALGLPTGLFLAFSAVYFVEAGRNTFATPRELEAVMQEPVLATIPFDGKLCYALTGNTLLLALALPDPPTSITY